jgi:hypothetical protein
MISWAGGWFFLMAAEQFTPGDKDFRLPGLGSYLKSAADAGNLAALALGLATLIAIIVLLDQLLWRPLVAWSEKFRFEQTESGEGATSAGSPPRRDPPRGQPTGGGPAAAATRPRAGIAHGSDARAGDRLAA